MLSKVTRNISMLRRQICGIRSGSVNAFFLLITLILTFLHIESDVSPTTN